MPANEVRKVSGVQSTLSTVGERNTYQLLTFFQFVAVSMLPLVDGAVIISARALVRREGKRGETEDKEKRESSVSEDVGLDTYFKTGSARNAANDEGGREHYNSFDVCHLAPQAPVGNERIMRSSCRSIRFRVSMRMSR